MKIELVTATYSQLDLVEVEFETELVAATYSQVGLVEVNFVEEEMVE